MKGIYKELITIILVGLGCTIILYQVFNYFTPYDNSDNPPKRSGMRIYKDHLTGCEYLRFGIFGSTLPRLTPLGKQVCIGDSNEQ